MKSIKIIGIAVATLGVAASIGGAVALYTKAVENTEFTIGAGTHTETTGTLTYLINGLESPTIEPEYYTTDDKKGDGLDATHTQVKYSFPLSATYSNDVATPLCTLGKVTVSVTDISASLQGHLTIWAGMTGYGSGNLGAHYYGDSNFFGGDFAITDKATSYSVGKEVSVHSAGGETGQTLEVYLKFNGLVANNSELYDLDEGELDYTITVTWGKPSDEYSAAYIGNNKTAFEPDPAYRMAPDIDFNNNGQGYTDQWQWVGAIKGTAEVTEGKCREGSKWCGGNNFKIDNGTTYDVYWDGEDGAGTGNHLAYPVARPAV